MMVTPGGTAMDGDTQQRVIKRLTSEPREVWRDYDEHVKASTDVEVSQYPRNKDGLAGNCLAYVGT